MPLRPKSQALKILEGNAGKRRLDASADVAYAVGAPEAPKNLKGDALTHWRWLESILIPARVLTPADFGIMVLTTNAYAYMRRLERACQRRRTITYEEQGSKQQLVTRRYPEFELLDRAERKYLRMLTELGLTPASRTRVKAMPNAETSGVGQFFERTS